MLNVTNKYVPEIVTHFYSKHSSLLASTDLGAMVFGMPIRTDRVSNRNSSETVKPAEKAQRAGLS